MRLKETTIYLRAPSMCVCFLAGVIALGALSRAVGADIPSAPAENSTYSKGLPAGPSPFPVLAAPAPSDAAGADAPPPAGAAPASIWRLSARGKLLWSRDVGTEQVHVLAVDKAGNLWAGGKRTDTANIWKLDPEGKLLASFDTGDLAVYGLAFDEEGNLFVATNGRSLPGQLLPHLLKMSPEGKIMWNQKAVGTADPAGFFLGVDRGVAYALSGPGLGKAFAYDAANGEPVAPGWLPEMAAAWMFTFDAEHHVVMAGQCMSSRGQGILLVEPGAGGKLLASHPVLGALTVALDPQGGFVTATSTHGNAAGRVVSLRQDGGIL